MATTLEDLQTAGVGEIRYAGKNKYVKKNDGRWAIGAGDSLRYLKSDELITILIRAEARLESAERNVSAQSDPERRISFSSNRR